MIDEGLALRPTQRVQGRAILTESGKDSISSGRLNFQRIFRRGLGCGRSGPPPKKALSPYAQLGEAAAGAP